MQPHENPILVLCYYHNNTFSRPHHQLNYIVHSFLLSLAVNNEKRGTKNVVNLFSIIILAFNQMITNQYIENMLLEDLQNVEYKRIKNFYFLRFLYTSFYSTPGRIIDT